MASVYPGGLDSLATNKANATATTTDHPDHHNDLADAVNKIEAELGVTPSGAAATVAARFTALDATVAAASVPAPLMYPYGHVAGETPHAADDFFSTFSGYTTHAPTGTVTWAASRGGLGVKFSTVGASNLAVAVKAVPVGGFPLTIETGLNGIWDGNDNPGAGIIFTDGTVNGSNLAAVGLLQVASLTNIDQSSGTLAAASRNTLSWSLSAFGHNSPLYLRLIWKAANTFAFALSPDGGTWVDFTLADVTRTFTPTHMGFYCTNWGSVPQKAAVFNYLRVYAADLSVA